MSRDSASRATRQSITKKALEVINAALALRDKEGWIFRYAKDDVKYQIVDIKKMNRLEKALERYKPRKP